MPALKKVAHTEVFAGLSQEAKSLGEQMDCAVKAISVVTGLPYATCHAAVAAAGRNDRRRTPDRIWKAALDTLGFDVREWSAKERIEVIMSYPKKGIATITTHHPRRFPKVWGQFADRALLFRSRGHISGVTGGVVHDWAINSSKQVFEVYEVTKKA